MGANNKEERGPTGSGATYECGRQPARIRTSIRRLTWVIASISVHLEELRYFWGKALGISGPQWMILMALAEIDQDDGVPVNVVSKKLHVDSSFVTTQSKLLEKKGFIRRKTSTDGRQNRADVPDRQDLQAAGNPGLAAGSR